MTFWLPDGFSLSWVNLERLLEWGVGLFFIYHALNGFFGWQKIPAAAPRFEKFLQALYDTEYLMPTVKFTELVAGLMLVLHWWPLFATAILAPIVFVIVSAHFYLNLTRGWRIALATFVPYAFLLLCQSDRWKLLWSL